ncbi:MAG: hypothetical protein J0H92_17040 [Sphingobacteriales bacterium]|jgi:hypothetical protein|nr:hypothetical protein [Sphingobacteriales bacterium]NCT74098.1 hypothetical protein [Chitinophagaceae bacterium]OJW34108.1 MAG: hypothetical protein BGO54_05415 [Sphingobacteriales bacterium 46-32]
MKVELAPNETTIDTWALNYTAPDSKTSMGKLTVTNKRLVFLPQHDAGSFSLSVYNKNGAIILEKSAIKDITAQKSLLSKKVVITMSDGSVHAFNYGIMNIDRILAAVQAN